MIFTGIPSEEGTYLNVEMDNGETSSNTDGQHQEGDTDEQGD